MLEEELASVILYDWGMIFYGLIIAFIWIMVFNILIAKKF